MVGTWESGVWVGMAEVFIFMANAVGEEVGATEIGKKS